jgi:hypothetical protein
MAKKEPKDRPSMAPEAECEFSPFMQAAIEKNQETFGRDRVFMGEDSEKLNVGLPWPALSLAWLSDVNVLPFKVIGIAGPSGSNKSSLGFEFGRIFGEHKGSVLMDETEGGKFSAPLIRSIIPKTMYKKGFNINVVNTINDAQEIFTNCIMSYDKAAESKETLEASKRWLTMLLLDSLAGSDTAGTATKIRKEGSVQASVATMAKAWMGYFRWASSAIVGFPISLVVVNHLLDVVGSTVHAKYTPGGKGQRYFSALSFFVNRKEGPKPPMKTFTENGETIKREHEVRRLVIKTEKSSFGTEGRKIEVDFIWYHNELGQQVSYFDWHAATTQILIENQQKLWHKDSKTKLKDFLDVSLSSAGGGTYDSKKLGLKGVQDHELGKALMQDKDLVEEVYDFLHINKHQVWDGRMPAFTDSKRIKKRAPTVEEAIEEGDEIISKLKEEEDNDTHRTTVVMPSAPEPLDDLPPAEDLAEEPS